MILVASPGRSITRTELAELAQRIVEAASYARVSLVTAESCTGGSLAVLLSNAPGAGDCFHGGFVTYSKQNKTKALGVSAQLLRDKSAVCPEVAVAMAEGAIDRSPADLAISITGVAGPDPDEDGNPVGRVCMAVARPSRPAVSTERYYGAIGKDDICRRAVKDALLKLLGVIESAETTQSS
jgi:nicotinamide-nucleotide amidase